MTIDPDTGDIRVYGQELDEDGNVVREWDDTPSDFGRIAAQAAKQVILQRIRENWHPVEGSLVVGAGAQVSESSGSRRPMGESPGTSNNLLRRNVQLVVAQRPPSRSV